MDVMFTYASSFNSDLSAWDVSSVTNMYAVFAYASSFNSDLSSWDVSSVTNMNQMFRDTFSFNSDLSAWDVSGVTSMNQMFDGASSFNSDLSAWDVSSVTNMGGMFSYSSFISDISSWDVSSVTNMAGMFWGASLSNVDISSWDVSSVTDMRYMFQYATSFNGDISSWDVSSVEYLSAMFYDATSFNSDLSSWDVSSVTIMTSMFFDASSFNGDISSWDVSSVTEMNYMFAGASSFNGEISSWDVSSVQDMDAMFDGASALSEENKCLIHTSFSSNSAWPYDWSEFCPFVCSDLVSHDGYDYSTVQIGEQCWFSENCRYLPEVSPSIEGSETEPYYYVYDYQGTDVAAAKATDNYSIYGVLYNWPAVMTEGICPSGWHIPSDGEWQMMEMSLGMSESEAASDGWRGSPVGDYMKSTSGWNSDGNGSNSSGFTGLPGGYRYSVGFSDVGNNGYLWSASESGILSWRRGLYSSYGGVSRDYDDRYDGFSARCVRDD
jgi:uncharacterized protein (TIGR02145 family)